MVRIIQPTILDYQRVRMINYNYVRLPYARLLCLITIDYYVRSQTCDQQLRNPAPAALRNRRASVRAFMKAAAGMAVSLSWADQWGRAGSSWLPR